jgi:hypothetical protein
MRKNDRMLLLRLEAQPFFPPVRSVQAPRFSRPLKILETILTPVASGRQPGLAAACPSCRL